MTKNHPKSSKVIPAPFAERPAKPDNREPKGKKPDMKTSPQASDAQSAPASRKKKRKKRKGPVLSWLMFVLLPTIMVGAYYALIAADQYAVETRFAVRSGNPSISGGILSTLGLTGGNTASDTYIVLEYIHSREILKRIDDQLNLRKLFAKPDGDFYAALDKDTTFEEFVKYWRSMVEVSLDRISYIVTVKVFAFSAEDSRAIAQAILDESERMVNELSERSRADAVAYIQKEVDKAEERLRKIRQQFLQFRSKTQEIDPAKKAQVQVLLIGKLEEQLANLQAKMSEARSYLSANAPTVVFLKNRIAAIKRQIEAEKKKLGGRGNSPRFTRGKNENLSKLLSEYEALVVEREFAEKAYVSALAGLEQARLMANRQQRYLATFVRPYMPDEATYPKRIRNTIFIFLGLMLLWALGALMVQSIRDRM